MAGKTTESKESKKKNKLWIKVAELVKILKVFINTFLWDTLQI